jgi:CRISPR-associated exonuclease Cas4
MVAAPPLPISALEHHEYCPRQCALIHVDGVWDDNRHTVRGSRGHRRVDGASSRQERGRMVLRGLLLWSERWNLTGRADAVEVGADGQVIPVEYKMGSRHGRAAEVQLCAQAFCLEEMLGVQIFNGAIWYAGPRRRNEIPLDDELRERTARAISAVRETVLAGVLPPAVNDRRCDECQLLEHCLPGLTDGKGGSHVLAYVDRQVFQCDS